ncbi:putative ribokinase [Podospora pseudoanserina]|uniref:Ribokinase n=1 Tax=Podospora pseudoanserina TaxID=2609844 RepID=A0ABR0IC84_9PEZI|nr:putative ribokinase [Podospora pseudoanserina]
MSSQIPHITILGSLNTDLVAYVPHHPLPGETLTATSFLTSPGGKGSNQAVACAKLSRPRDLSSPSAHVSMVGAVGSDSNGDLLLSNLATHGVDSSLVTKLPNKKTGVAMIVVEAETGQNRIIISGEANHQVGEEYVTQGGWLDKTDLLIMQLEIPMGTVLKAVEEAKRRGVDVLLNPAPAKILPDGVYDGLRHLIVNETEAAILGGVEEKELDTLEGLERVGKGFVGKGVENFIATLGGRGVFYLTKGGRSGLIEAEKGVKVVDTTGAGDTFVGRYALEAARARKEGGEFDVGGAVGRANKAAAVTVTREGAARSIPWRDEVE